ncbi:MAG: zinc-dependent metalloprotease [Bacteroidota bacterium]
MKLKLLFALLVVQLSSAQHRTCGMQAKMTQIMNDPAQRAAYIEQQNSFEVELHRMAISSNKNGNSVNSVIKIPVAVHFPAVATTSTLKACLRTLAQSQINILNADYNATNADIVNFVSDADYYPGTNIGSLQVEFVLATQNHPAGTGLVNGDLAVTFGTDFLANNDNDSTWAGYMNLVCKNAGNGILGYSPLGGSPSGGNCVVISKTAFGAGSGCTGYVPDAPYNLGRTLTHELGHFFNLDHTFDGCDGPNCATSGDRVCDTPDTNTESYECPVAGEVGGCTDLALTMNYMDYTNDACMYMFTAGQATRMQAWYNAIASQFRTDVLGNEAFLQNDFSIYPNPSNGTFTIQFKDMMNSYSVEVFDVMGKTIYENSYDQSANLTQVINLDNATSGVYFVNIKSENGIVTKKLLIQ